MGGNDTTIGLTRKLRDELASMKIIPDETYQNVLKRLIEDSKKIDNIRKTLSSEESPERKIEEIKRILEAK